MRETETSAPSLGDWEANLEALSKAATPGPWQHIVGDDYYIESQSYPPKATHNPCVIDSGWWLAVGNRPSDYGEANSKFIVALVNAYREGRMARAADAEHYMHLATERAEIIRSHPTAMAEAVASARAEGWQPIETAPKDGAHILVAKPGSQPIRAWFQNHRWWMHGRGPFDGSPVDLTGNHAPTHWMPLPAPPTLIPGGSSDV